MPKGATTDAYRILNGLRRQIHQLHPAQIELIDFALKLPAVINVHESGMRAAHAAPRDKTEAPDVTDDDVPGTGTPSFTSAASH